MLASKIIEQLIAARVARGWSAHKLALVMGYSESCVGNWERQNNCPTMAALVDWCNALDYDLEISLRCLAKDVVSPKAPRWWERQHRALS